MKTLIHFEKDRRRRYVWCPGLLWLLFFGHTCMLPNRVQSHHETTVSSVQSSVQEVHNDNPLTHDHTVPTDVLPKKEDTQKNVLVLIVLGVVGSIAVYMGLQRLMKDPIEEEFEKAQKSLSEAELTCGKTESNLSAKRSVINGFDKQIQAFIQSKEALKSNRQGKEKTIQEHVKKMKVDVDNEYTKYKGECSQFEVETDSEKEAEKNAHNALNAWNKARPKNLKKCEDRTFFIQKFIALDPSPSTR